MSVLNKMTSRVGLVLTGISFCTVLASCQSNDSLIDIAVKNDCGQTITIGGDNDPPSWSTLDAGKTQYKQQTGTDENLEFRLWRLSIAPPNGAEDPEHWTTHVIELDDIEIGDGVGSDGETYEALVTVEGDLCP